METCRGKRQYIVVIPRNTKAITGANLVDLCDALVLDNVEHQHHFQNGSEEQQATAIIYCSNVLPRKFRGMIMQTRRQERKFDCHSAKVHGLLLRIHTEYSMFNNRLVSIFAYGENDGNGQNGQK